MCIERIENSQKFSVKHRHTFGLGLCLLDNSSKVKQFLVHLLPLSNRRNV